MAQALLPPVTSLTFPQNIPAELRERLPWVLWKPKRKPDGGLMKIPVDWHRPQESIEINPHTKEFQGTFDEVVYAMNSVSHGLFGIGCVLTKGCGVSCFDLDDVANSQQTFEWLQKVLERQPTFAEISISGNGLHAFFLGELAYNRASFEKNGLSIYSHSQFIAVTGRPIPKFSNITNGHVAEGAGLFEYLSSFIDPPQTYTAISGQWPLEKIAEFLSYIQDNITYNQWLACLMAVYKETGGSDAGFNVVDKWCSTAPLKYEGSGKLYRRWSGLGRSIQDNNSSMGIIYNLAKNAGAPVEEIRRKYNLATTAVARSVIFGSAPVASDEPETAEQRKARTIFWSSARLLDAAVKAEQVLINLNYPIFDIGGTLVELGEDRLTEQVTQRVLKKESLYEIITRLIFWEQYDPDLIQVASRLSDEAKEAERLAQKSAEGGKAVDPALLQTAQAAKDAHKNAMDRAMSETVTKKLPLDVAMLMLQRQFVWPWRKLKGISRCPYFNPETGEIVSKLGYHEESQLFVASSVKMVDVGDAYAALNRLRDVLRETRYDGAESESAALAGIMTAVLRNSFNVVPGWIVTAHEPGSGKSSLQLFAGILATGAMPPVMTFGNNIDEFEKKLGGKLLGGESIIVIDNFNGVVRGELLAQVVSQEILSIRRLGESTMFSIINKCHLQINGNNIEVEGEQRRRHIATFLDPKMEHPEQRQFTGERLEKVAFKFRSELVSCILTMVSEYVRSGTARAANSFVGFEEWNALIPSTLVWLGMRDPLATAERVRAEDSREATIRVMINELYERTKNMPSVHIGNGVTGVGEFRVSDLIDLKDPSKWVANSDDLKACITAVAGDPNGRINERRLGIYFSRTLKGLVRDGKRFDSRDVQGRIVYRVELVR